MGKERKNVKKALKYKKPKQWVRDCVAMEMNHDDCNEPPFLYGLNVLQKASQENQYEELGLQKGCNIYESITKLKASPELSKFIRHTGYDIFYQMYWSPEQISLHNEILKKLKHPLAIDATGSIAFKVQRPNGESKHLFLTAMATYVENTIVPVFQVISEQNDTGFYQFALIEWLKAGAKIPKEIVSNMGKALQNAVSLTFNHLSFTKYNDKCLQILMGQSEDKINTFIRTDVAHLQHAVCRWSCFKKCSPKVQEMYKRCVGFMSTIDNLKDFSKFSSHVFQLSESKMFTAKVKESLEFIIKRIQTFTFDFTLSASSLNNTVHDENKKKWLSLDEDNNNMGLTYKYMNNIKENVIKNMVLGRE